MSKNSASKAAEAARRLEAGRRYSEALGITWEPGVLERADVFLKGTDAMYKPLTAREIAVLRATIRKNLRAWAAGKVRVIPLVADPAIQATESLVQRCEEFANVLPEVLKNRETRRAQQFMLALSETLTTTSEVFETKVSRDTALIVQRQFRDRFKRCLSRFDWCCEALLDSVSGAEHTRALRARLEGDLRGAASDQVLAKGFTDEAYERLNRAMAAAQKGPIAPPKQVKTPPPPPPPPSPPTTLTTTATVYHRIKAAPDRHVTLRELAKAVGKSERVLQDWRKAPRVLKACPELKTVPAQVACRGARVSLHKAADAFHNAGFLK